MRARRGGDTAGSSNRAASTAHRTASSSTNDTSTFLRRSLRASSSASAAAPLTPHGTSITTDAIAGSVASTASATNSGCVRTRHDGPLAVRGVHDDAIGAEFDDGRCRRAATRHRGAARPRRAHTVSSTSSTNSTRDRRPPGRHDQHHRLAVTGAHGRTTSHHSRRTATTRSCVHRQSVVDALATRPMTSAASATPGPHTVAGPTTTTASLTADRPTRPERGRPPVPVESAMPRPGGSGDGRTEPSSTPSSGLALITSPKAPGVAQRGDDGIEHGAGGAARTCARRRGAGPRPSRTATSSSSAPSGFTDAARHQVVVVDDHVHVGARPPRTVAQLVVG